MRRLGFSWWFALAVLSLAGCGEEAGSEPTRVVGGGDCRQDELACADGFLCRPDEQGRWACIPDERAGGGRGGQGGGGGAGGQGGRGGSPVDAGASEGAGPAEPCQADGQCESGECGMAPGGYCVLVCGSDADCGRGAACVRGPDGRRVCLQACAGNEQCRKGWVCTGGGEGANTCQPSCTEVGCPVGRECDAEAGICVAVGCQPRAERCDGMDEDCDGVIDEGATNACGTCGDVPVERCNEEDDDCDGAVDEGVTNACGECGPAPREQCNGEDDDCDGETDEGVTNACGECGPAPREACNRRDDDCDGVVDDGATCPGGERCERGACVPLSGPAGACDVDADCASGSCLPDVPGGFCSVPCRDATDCDGGDCFDMGGGESICLDLCAVDADCRQEWICLDGAGACWPHCAATGCEEGFVCTESGLCDVAVYTIRLGTVVLRPYIDADRTNWDGPGSATADLVQRVTGALLGPDPYTAILNLVVGGAIDSTIAPDAFGRVSLTLNAQPVGEVILGVVDNEYRPHWRNAVWQGVALEPGTDVRLDLSLTDEDIAAHDPIGRVVVGTEDLLAAAFAGEPYPVDTSDQGSRNILFVEVELIPEN